MYTRKKEEELTFCQVGQCSSEFLFVFTYFKSNFQRRIRYLHFIQFNNGLLDVENQVSVQIPFVDEQNVAV